MIDQDAITARVVSNLPQGVKLYHLTAEELQTRIDEAFSELLAETMNPRGAIFIDDPVVALPVSALPPFDP